MPDLEVTELLDLANSRHPAAADDGDSPGEHDHLASPGEARSYLAGQDLDVPPGAPSEAELGRLIEVRDLAHDMLETPDSDWRSAAARVAAQHLFRFDEAGRVAPVAAGWDGFTASFVPQLFVLAAERSRLQHCANPTCRWLFIDRSKNHSRVWCDMSSCGSRAKMRRYRSRRGTASKAG